MHTDRRSGTMGVWAALYLAGAYLLAIPFFLVVVDYPSATEPAEKVRLLVDHHAAMRVMYLISYVVFGIVLAVLALALHERLRTSAPALMTVATGAALLWAGVLVASGLIFNAGMAAVVHEFPTDPARAVAMWQAIEPVAAGLGGSGGELLGGVWLLLVSVAVLRSVALPARLGWFGAATGVIGLLSVVTVLADVAVVLGLLQLVWFLWLAVAFRRGTEQSPAVVASAITAPANAVRDLGGVMVAAR